MQRAMRGDCVAWKPEIAPQAMLMKSVGGYCFTRYFGVYFATFGKNDTLFEVVLKSKLDIKKKILFRRDLYPCK